MLSAVWPERDDFQADLGVGRAGCVGWVAFLVIFLELGVLITKLVV